MINIDNIIEENKHLKAKNTELEEKLKKYTNSIGHKNIMKLTKKLLWKKVRNIYKN